MTIHVWFLNCVSPHSQADEIWGAIKTCDLALEAADQLYVPVTKSWRLNERMVGALTGLGFEENVVGGESEWIRWLKLSQGTEIYNM